MDKKENKKPTAPKEKQEERKHYRAVATVPENNSKVVDIKREIYKEVEEYKKKKVLKDMKSG